MSDIQVLEDVLTAARIVSVLWQEDRIAPNDGNGDLVRAALTELSECVDAALLDRSKKEFGR